ncbi:MAG: hypothetical protein OEW75_03530 [Cyclobacteriaceae bacterium]|nr:hypothetical protein [Cyclobacteriaceae bacterium]
MFSTQQKRINWIRYLSSKSKLPYGTYALSEYLPELYSESVKSRSTFRELLDTLSIPENFISISQNFEPTILDIELILERASEGSNFLISAQTFGQTFADTLNLKGNYEWSERITAEYEKEFIFSISNFFKADTIHIKPENPHFTEAGNFVIRKNDQLGYFKSIDTLNTRLLATNSDKKALAIHIKKGKGSIILSSSPYLFTNIYFLYGENESFSRYLMSYLPGNNIHWTEFYEVGRGEAQSPLRYVLNQPALKFAIYSTLFSLLVFVFFEAKRRQRIIPVITAPVNATLQFVKTIGNLYFENKGHKSVAEKRYLFFLEFIRTRYFLDTNHLDDSLAERLHKKSGVSLNHIKIIFKTITHIQGQSSISSTILEKLSKDLDLFYNYTD